MVTTRSLGRSGGSIGREAKNPYLVDKATFLKEYLFRFPPRMHPFKPHPLAHLIAFDRLFQPPAKIVEIFQFRHALRRY